LEDFLKLRKEYASYAVFYRTFIRTVVGKSRYKKMIDDMNVSEEIATVSDEALALLAMENGIERWNDEYTLSGGQTQPIRKGQTKPEEWKSTVPTKYTVARTSGNSGQQDGHDKRWSQNGIARFNKLRQSIIKDREKHSGFITKFLAEERKDLVSTTTTAPSATGKVIDAEDDFTTSVATAKLPPASLKDASQVAGVDGESDDEGEKHDDDESSGDEGFGS
jgi:hypothetical protein